MAEFAAVEIPFVGTFTPHDCRGDGAARTTARFVAAHGLRGFARDAGIGHVTASGFVVSPDRTMTLLMHHRKLDRWLQPGGHCDGNPDVRAVAAREVAEETGLTDIRLLSPRVFDIDVHSIPARGAEPEHLHYDIRFLFESDSALPVPGNGESLALAWIGLTELERVTRAGSVLVVRNLAGW
ncbi:MAG: NUDIX domain-containing protein [Rhodobacteraceae bacterium]|nr:NUDIX domain-containing protein [Paracoccaceae bacterium]